VTARLRYAAGTITLLVRMAPYVAAWLASLLWTEFAPRTLLARMLSASGLPHLQWLGTILSARGADAAMTAALLETFGQRLDLAVHPEDPGPQRPGLLATALLYRRYTLFSHDIAYGPDPDNLLDVWRDPARADTKRAPVLLQGSWGSVDGRKQTGASSRVARSDDSTWLGLRFDHVPKEPSSQLAGTSDRCQTRDRLGASEYRKLRWRPRFHRADRWLCGGSPHRDGGAHR
jgi:hypothetical protein